MRHGQAQRCRCFRMGSEKRPTGTCRCSKLLVQARHGKVHKQKKSGSFGITMVKRHVRAPYISRSKGIISQYDAEFMKGSRHIGWDWRLIAAQCYQESGFDPNAVSWAGAKGLMQIIPSTAASLGIKKHLRS